MYEAVLIVKTNKEIICGYTYAIKKIKGTEITKNGGQEEIKQRQNQALRPRLTIYQN